MEELVTKNTADGKLENTFVREYYDRQVGGLSDTYTESRWFSSPARKFEYKQTKRALAHALGNRKYASAIEIGPGDAVWTGQIADSVTGSLHLIEQSEEMYLQAKDVLKGREKITIERSDFMDANPPSTVELIVASRCFEYFSEKKPSLEKMRSLLLPKGRLIIITKNADMFTTKSVQSRLVHSDQLTKEEMVAMLEESGFVIENVFPAVTRWKIKYASMRLIFDILHRISTWSDGRIAVPLLTRYATESYVYVATRS
jgi:ubiquinone/menaquinone biosynthesis C-methylase UbiE